MDIEVKSTKQMLDVLRKHNSVLELGCGRGNLVKSLYDPRKPRKLVALDAWPKSIEIAKKQVKGVNFQVMDIRKIGTVYAVDEFECICGMDIIEHLDIKDAYKVLDACDKIASKCQVFFIPVGKHVQVRDTKGVGGNHHWDTHRSTWYPDMMVKRGFEVWHFDDWYQWPEGAPKDPNAMWCLKGARSKSQLHECKRRAKEG